MDISEVSFALKQIVPTDIFRNYKQGNFKDVSLDNLNQNFEKYVQKIRKKYLDTTKTCFETIKLTNGKTYQVAFTNMRMWETFKRLQDEKYLEPSPQVPCIWCRRKCKTTDEYTLCGGIPAEINILSNISLFDVVIRADTFQCALAEIEKRLERYPSESLFRESKRILLRWFQLAYPGQFLVAARDYYLLNINGGPLDEDEFFTNEYTFKQTEGLKIFPAQIRYAYTQH